ncbi:hypothetical protein PGIGA_G00130890 [Pangasianodon gigas]|uniref:Uncharacterized protein n=1 Tax=Pangasianodon gigas TaxID=30993 RepID=A0ACC5XIE0_PANGG|nr:hypothetical protein [Pangasianodon gigas]
MSISPESRKQKDMSSLFLYSNFINYHGAIYKELINLCVCVCVCVLCCYSKIQIDRVV